ncbi:SRPBCC family protein [Paenibacillus chungangensis]|uniref:SRPBCC family protein n=1 Tax=Paenibacillus chungangensis TaxID=696535 RepID=A0ABW3HSH8_9BACL
MGTSNPVTITVEAIVQAPIEQVWTFWTEPEHITNWCAASDDWHAPRAENDLRAGGKFVTRMEAKDGSFGFDFGGIYDEVRANEFISYTMEDGRKVAITFVSQGNDTKVVEVFDAETANSVEMQEAGWQAILNNFKAYSEASKGS